MQYRKFGKTGRDISVLGFGCMRLPEFQKDDKWHIDEEKAIPMLQRAYKEGVNYFDTAWMYCHDNSQYTLGRAVKGMKREDVMIATKQPLHMVEKTEDYRKVLEMQLERLDMPYIDFYHFHGINRGAMDGKIKPLGLIKEAQKAIDEGLIKHMSFSFHGDPKDMQYLIEQGEIFSSVLLQYNLLDRSNEENLAIAKENGLGVVVMGPVGGGRLGAPSDVIQGLLKDKPASTAEMAIRFVMANENVDVVLSGMQNMAQLEENAKVAAAAGKLTEAEIAQVKLMMTENAKLAKLYCTSCNYCLPCPQEINIPHLFNIMNNHRVYGLTDHAKGAYGQVMRGEGWVKSATADKCTGCGVCETKCPQKLPIVEQLKETHAALA